MPPSTRPQGVRFKVLRDLLQEAQGLGLSSTTEVCNGLIKPRTEEQKCAYVDTLPADAVADATVFVSHAWRYDLADSIDVMEQHEKEHPGSVFWFDLVMNNQHGTAERPFEWWCHTFQNCCEATTACQHTSPLRHLWLILVTLRASSSQRHQRLPFQFRKASTQANKSKVKNTTLTHREHNSRHQGPQAGSFWRQLLIFTGTPVADSFGANL